MLALDQWLSGHGAARVEVHPDGMQAKHFDIAGWLEAQGCKEVAERGRTRGTGVYRHAAETLAIDFRSALGDVVAEVESTRVLVEASGGCIHSRSPGQPSKPAIEHG